MKVFWLAASLALSPACRPRQDVDSAVNFRAAQSPGLVAVADKPIVRICVNWLGLRDKEVHDAATSWFIGLEAVNKSHAVPDVQVVPDSNGFCDAQVNLTDLGGAPANTYLQAQPVINWDKNPDTWFGSYNVLVHEMGHAFGLLDTYVVEAGGSGKAGNCYEGQPHDAVMCSPFWPHPMADDVNGVRSRYLAKDDASEIPMPTYDDNAQTQVPSNLAKSVTSQFTDPPANPERDPATTTSTPTSNTNTASDDRPSQGDYCPFHVTTKYITEFDSPVTGKIVRLGLKLTAAARSATVCVGDTKVCRGSYHNDTPRLITFPATDDGKAFVTDKLTKSDMAAFDAAKSGIVVMGTDGANHTYVCELAKL